MLANLTAKWNALPMPVKFMALAVAVAAFLLLLNDSLLALFGAE